MPKRGRRTRKPKRAPPKKRKKDKKLFELLYFVAILAFFAAALNYVMAARPDMTFEQRVVAHHTASILNTFSGNVQIYEWSVEAGERYSTELKNSLLLLGFEEIQGEGGTEFRKARLLPDDERVAELFLEQRMRMGERIHISKANIILSGGFKIEIIPECVGWVGIFAAAALILAYPRAGLKKRVLGLFIALPLMYAMNILRLVLSIAVVDTSNLAFFEFVHNVLWQFLLVAWALCLWLFWIYFVVEEKDIKDVKKDYGKIGKIFKMLTRKK
jgi:exosortase/archaeosortase family protein